MMMKVVEGTRRFIVPRPIGQIAGVSITFDASLSARRKHETFHRSVQLNLGIRLFDHERLLRRQVRAWITLFACSAGPTA
jgi:hypothetical protein